MLGKKRLLREGSLVEPIVRNPFVHWPRFRWPDRLMIAVNAVFLMPLRIVAITIVMSLAILTAYIITAGLSDEHLRTRPLSGWRAKLKKVLRVWGRAVAFCFGFHHIKKNGRRATRQEAPILIAAPHSTFLDAFVFFILGLPYSVSRAENSQIVFLGRLFKAVQPINVTREDSKNKLTVIEEIKKRSRPDGEWPGQLLVFPEGTTTNRSCLITFKPGSFSNNNKMTAK